MRTQDKERFEKLCRSCGGPMPRVRLEAVPGVTTCVESAGRVDPRKYDLSQSSPINRNGFAPSD